MRPVYEFYHFMGSTDMLTIASGWVIGMGAIELVTAFVNDLIWPVITYIFLLFKLKPKVLPEPPKTNIANIVKAMVTFALTLVVTYAIIYLFLSKFVMAILKKSRI